MRIVILGAGSIGCYIGGRLALAGAPVTFVGRPRMQKALQKNGLQLTHYNQSKFHLKPDQFEFATTSTVIAQADIVILTVKSQDTQAALLQLKKHIKPRATLLSLQNGVGNIGRLKAALHNVNIVGAMVPFNVLNRGDGHFHCGTEGDIHMQANHGDSRLVSLFERAGLSLVLSKDIEGVHWGKLLMNLNNALNLLSDKPLQQQLSDRNYRRVLALSIAEALRCMDKAKIKPVRIGKVRPRLLPFVLRLPDNVFQILAKGMLKMDPQARSSMWEDLQSQRQSEIDYLNGHIVALGKQLSMPTPVNTKLVELVKKTFSHGVSPAFDGQVLLSLMQKK